MKTRKRKIDWLKLIAFILYNIFNIMLFYILYIKNIDFITFLVLFYSVKFNTMLLNNEK